MPTSEIGFNFGHLLAGILIAMFIISIIKEWVRLSSKREDVSTRVRLRTPDLEPDEAEIDEGPTELNPPPRVHQEATQWDAPSTFIPRKTPSDQGPAELLGRVMASREPAGNEETTIDSDVSDLAQQDAEAHGARYRHPHRHSEPLDEDTDREAPTVP